MKDIEIITKISERNYNELSETERKLVDAARKATGGSYAPYSRFKVGAAILLDNEEIVIGANQENVAFPSGTCAERSACYYAGANFPDARFEMIAISAVGTDGLEPAMPVAPCGACRQALLQYETLAGHNVRVILAGRDSIYIVPSVKALLPLTFSEF